jgi:hypothetical protein
MEHQGLALQDWARHRGVIGILNTARPQMPRDLGGRQAAMAEPLIAIADPPVANGVSSRGAACWYSSKWETRWPKVMGAVYCGVSDRILKNRG